jgi:sphingomyelin phosphodiesterase
MSIGSKTSKLFCTTLVGLCSFPPVSTSTIAFPSPKPTTARPTPSNQQPIQIVQYSDIHVDPFYVTGSSDNCTKPICCRNYDSTTAPGNNDSPAGPYGEHSCDVPVSLEQSMYNAIKAIAPNAKFSLFTGDVVDHAVWNTTQAQNTIDINDAYSRMGGLNMPIFGTVGNHEMSPANSFQPTAFGNSAQWVYNLVSSLWAPWIGASAASAEEAFGAYSTLVANTNLRIISLNTNMYYTLNFWLYEPTMETDPSGQFAWLVNELQSAETAGERVYIIGHMPLGASDAFHDPSHLFNTIVNRYSATIAAMFFGHTHKDEFQISYSVDTNAQKAFNNAVAMSYVMPSLTPTDGMPAFRIYTIDPVSFAVLDSTTYIADMNNAAFQTTGPVWTKYYSAKETYGPLVSPAPAAGAELSPAFWHNVTTAFTASDSAFQGYWEKRTRGWDVSSCTGTCETQAICQLQAARSEDNCFTPSPGIHFSKRDAGHEVHENHCGGSLLRDVFSAIATRRSVNRM